ncbi:MAG: hypothetical protein KBE65_16605 [Phycisphaerae bacterium]|nr:hypothetical protein [Phycisphaerae bacterium]
MGDSMSRLENPDNPMVLLQRLHRWRMAFFGVTILIAGLTIGAAGALLMLRRTSAEPSMPVGGDLVAIEDGIVPRLRLSAGQAEQVRPVLRKYMQRLNEIREQGRVQISKELDAMDEEISTSLNPDQQQRWRDLLRGLPGPFHRGAGRFGSGRQGPFGPRGGQGRLRRSSEGSVPSPNEPALPDRQQ